MLSACWPGVSKISMMRKDGRSQRMSLANNPSANAAAEILAVHGAENGRGGAWRQGSCRRRTPRCRGSGLSRFHL